MQAFVGCPYCGMGVEFNMPGSISVGQDNSGELVLEMQVTTGHFCKSDDVEEYEKRIRAGMN